MFAAFGPVTSCVVMKDEGEAGRSKGFGFVNFDQPEDGGGGVEELNGKEINGGWGACSTGGEVVHGGVMGGGGGALCQLSVSSLW